jgi:hypothetical protein
MTRREWNICTDPDPMLLLLRDRGLLDEGSWNAEQATQVTASG